MKQPPLPTRPRPPTGPTPPPIPRSEDPSCVFLWGDIVDTALLVDLVGFLQQTRRAAVLTVSSGQIRKSVYFHEGQLMAASSNQPEDRFGDIMFRRGLITRAQLDRALAQVGPGRKIGNVLLSQGLISTGDLWKVIKLQIEEILCSVVLLESGQFTIASYPPAQIPTRASLDTQHVLLEGLRRKDELKHYQSELPPQDRVLCANNWQSSVGRLDSAEQTLWSLVDGRRTVAELLAQSNLGEFDATAALHRLLKAGLVSELPVATPGEAGGGGTTIGALISVFNEAFGRIYGAIIAEEGQPPTHQGFSAFFGDEPEVQALFMGLVPLSSGHLPTDQLFVNLKTSRATDKVAILRRGLTEYLRFLLFVARESLPFELVECLAAEVNDLVRGL